MRTAQRVVAGVFAAFQWLVAFGSIDGGGDAWIGLVVLMSGMGLVLWALRPNP